MKDTLNQILAHHTGRDLKQIQEDTDRDFFMPAEKQKNMDYRPCHQNREDLDKLEKWRANND